MGDIANKFANKVYITDDNPRNEIPSKIRKVNKIFSEIVCLIFFIIY